MPIPKFPHDLGDDAQSATPLQDQLAIVRAEEARTHRQQRLTNWLVVGFCIATLVVVVITKIQTSSDINTIVTNQGVIIRALDKAQAEEMADEASLYHLCIAEQDEAEGNHLPIVVCIVPKQPAQ